MRCLPYPIAAQASSVPPRILLLDPSSQKPPSHRLPRPPCGAPPRKPLNILSNDCAKFPTHCLGTVALRHLRLHSALALCQPAQDFAQPASVHPRSEERRVG